VKGLEEILERYTFPTRSETLTIALTIK